MEYKRIKKLVPYCKKCDKEIRGDGSLINPYWCDCGPWEYDTKKNDYVLNSIKKVDVNQPTK